MGTCHTKHLQDAGTLDPFVGDEDDDEFLGHQRQTQHQRECQEGCETKQFSEYGFLAVAVILDTGEHWLGDARNHA